MPKRGLAFLGLVALVAVAACGGDDRDAASTTTAVPDATTTSTTEVGPTTTTAPVGEDVVLGGRTVIPAENVGDVDLTALPVGDDLLADGAEAGHLYLCSTFPTDGGGAQVEGPWFNGDGTYDLTAKTFVLGDVACDPPG